MPDKAKPTNSAPPPAPLRTARRDKVMAVAAVISAPPLPVGTAAACGRRIVLGGAEHGAQDPRMRAAAAEIAGERLFRIVERWRRVLLQQRRGPHHHAVG